MSLLLQYEPVLMTAPECDRLARRAVDDRAAAEAEQALAAAGYRALRQVQVSAENGEIRLTGRLPSFHLRQIALQAVRTAPGVVRVCDELTVTA